MYEGLTTHKRPRLSPVASQSSVDPPLLDPLVDARHPSFLFDVSDTLELMTLDEVGRRIATSTAKSIGCSVLVAVWEPCAQRFRLIGDSRELERPRRLAPGDPIEQVLTESCVLGLSSEGAAIGTTIDLGTPLREELAHHLGVAWSRVCLLADSAGQVQGALVIFSKNEELTGLSQRLRLGENLRALPAYLRLRREAEANWRERFRTAMAATLRANRVVAWATILLCLGALLAIPVPHYVGADCQCEPATRRILTAPFDTQLAESLAKPGDVVKAGQLLAVFDGAEIASEIESLSAERNRIQQQQIAAIAKGEASVATEAALELQKLAHRLDILHQRQERLELCSPIDGVVVSGDLEESIGASLAIGQRLLEIAPLDRMTAEIYIDESDISLVRVDQPVSFGFQGAGRTNFDTTVDRIFPRAEVVDSDNVFVAEAQINGDLSSLAPGMRGRAKIYEGLRPLAWTLFYKPYLAVRRFWGWY